VENIHIPMSPRLKKEQKRPRQITVLETLDYEIRSSWWAGWISDPFLQSIVSKYFVWKVRRKYNRYELNRIREEDYLE
jgi:hypothetical protein